MDIPGFMPTRRIEQTEEGFIVYIKPPNYVGTREVSVFLTPAQFQRYEQWRDGPLLIQDALPELSISEREMLMSGLGDEDFRRMTHADDE
jgi:hypothetical protein